MSGQPHPKVRRNVSPSTIARPMKAKIPYSLKGRSPTSSPTFGVILPRRSPDSRHSPERRSPGSTSPRVTVTVERPKAVRVSSSPLRRTGSLEALCTSYVKGQWPSSSSDLLASFMIDKGTQTEKEDLEVTKYSSQKSSSKKKKSKDHRRSRSFGPGDQHQLALIRQKLQKSKEGSRQETYKLRQSPVPGNHQALLSTAPAALQNYQSQRSSKPLGIPSHIPKSNFSKIQRNSVEGLNTEIEKLVLRHHYEPDVEENDKSQDVPDGHRAPVPESPARGSSTRSVDTQTPGSQGSRDSGSRSQSVSPSYPIIPGPMDSSRPSSEVESGGMERLDKGESVLCESPDTSHLKIMSSPRPNKSYAFAREPPDGCEVVKVISEDSGKKAPPPSQPSIKEPLLYCPINPSQFVLKPSVDSAFCPLRKIYASQGTQSTGIQVAAPVIEQS